MRIKFGNKILEVSDICNPGGSDRFARVKTSKGDYIIDCEEPRYTQWLMNRILKCGYFDATGVDYNNDEQDESWFDYCISKTEDQKVFDKWINYGTNND